MVAPVVSVADANLALPVNVRVSAPLAQGGQGTVFSGTVDGQPAAVKFYISGPYETRITREVDALRRVSCDVIAPLLWAGEVTLKGTQTWVVATRLIPGVPLDKVLTQRALSSDEISAVIYDVADAIGALWTLRVVHRDLKPSNIILGATGRATVIDLGVARHVDMTSLTASGSTWGTRGYLSPEQARSVKQLTCKSDLFALGVIAVECALQRHPTGGDQARLLTAGLDQNLPSIVAAMAVAPLVKKLLAYRPTRRPFPERVIQDLSAFSR